MKVEITPLGSPELENVTAAVEPLTRVAPIDDVELVVPWTTVRLLGEGVERLKSNGGGVRETVSDMLVV